MEPTVVERPNVIHTEVAELAVVCEAGRAYRHSTWARSKSWSAGRTCHRVSATHGASSTTTAVSSAATLGKANDGNGCERKEQKRQ